MSTLVVCLDGTNQVKHQPDPTNVARIFDALGGAAADAGNGSWETAAAGAPALLGKYLPGVGTQGNAILRVLGSAFGDGIAEPIVRGYTFLSRNYQAGDEIFITGFSRGATAARALAGFVAVHGLLDPAKYASADKDAAYRRAIAAWYAYREPHPNFADQFRLNLIGQSLGGALPALNAGDYIAVPQIRAVGVFDTVSSLGLPQLDSNGRAVFDFTICDTALNAKVLNGFHALAADETRDLFSPTLWTDRAGVVQQIFPGAHSNVGGGYPERGLSDGALDWMLTQFQGVGLPFSAALIAPAVAKNPLDIARDDAVTFPFKDTPRRARAFPHCATPSQFLRDRLNRPTEVLPGSAVTQYKPTATYADGSPI
jgi:uncharacterized protein (DUF2235 family)